MDLFQAYKTDGQVEADGVWVPYEHVNVKVKLARAGGSNKQWEVERERAMRPLRKKYRDRPIPDSEVLEALVEPFCKLIIKGWEGVTKDGQPVKCDQKNKEALCRELPDFYAEMLADSGNRDYFLDDFSPEEVVEEAEKLQAGSGGTESTQTQEG